VLSLLEPVVAGAGDEERARLLRGAAGLAAPLVVGSRPGEALTSDQQAFSLLHETVEARLAAAYRKLDVSSRHELSARLDETEPREVPQ
jgi:hypothetical protein